MSATSRNLPQLQKYIDDGTVRDVFKDFPLTQIHPQAPKAARQPAVQAIRTTTGRCTTCSSRTSNNGRVADGGRHIQGFAKQRKLHQATFDQCLDSGKHAAVIAANETGRLGLWLRGTPGFFINRNLLAGADPIEAFQQLIDQELTAKGQ